MFVNRKTNRFSASFKAAVPLLLWGDPALTASPSGCLVWTPGHLSAPPSTPAGWPLLCMTPLPPEELPAPPHGYSSHLQHKHRVNNNKFTCSTCSTTPGRPTECQILAVISLPFLSISFPSPSFLFINPKVCYKSGVHLLLYIKIAYKLGPLRTHRNCWDDKLQTHW